MNARFGTGKLYFTGLKADINGDHYLIIKNIHENMVGTIIKNLWWMHKWIIQKKKTSTWKTYIRIIWFKIWMKIVFIYFWHINFIIFFYGKFIYVLKRKRELRKYLPCKLLYIEWISNKVLLHSTGHYVQYPVINHNGKEYEKECIYIYICIIESVWCTVEIKTTL